MIEIGYDFNIKDINKIKKYKNPTLDIFKSKLYDNSKYKIFLNKTQFNNLLKNNSIKYKLTDSKKNRNIMIGDGIGSLISMALNMIKPALPKIASTIGLAGLSTGVSHGINKALNKNKSNIIKLSDKQVNDINKNLDIINKSKIFNKKITLSRNGSGIFSILLPMLASTIIPALIKKGKGNNSNFFETKLKYPELFKRKNYPLNNIFINNLLKNNKNFMGCFSKDQIKLIENNKSMIINLQDSNQPGSHWIALKRVNNTIFVFDSFGIGYIPVGIFKVFKNLKIITNMYRIQDISSNLCGMFCVLFILYDIKSKNDFIKFLTLFNSNDVLKNELI